MADTLVALEYAVILAAPHLEACCNLTFRPTSLAENKEAEAVSVTLPVVAEGVIVVLVVFSSKYGPSP